MGRYDVRPCPCGSGEDSQWEYDARGIEIGRMCRVCKPRRLAGYRPEVLTDSNYDCDEVIEPEPEVKPAYGSQQWAETYSDDLGESPDW